MRQRILNEFGLLVLPRAKDFGVSPLLVFGFMSSSLSMYVLETAGFAMFLPLIEYVAKNRDLVALEQSSKFWTYLRESYSAVHLEVNLVTLMILILVLMALRVACEFVKQVSMHAITTRGAQVMRTKLMKAYLFSDCSYFYHCATGSVVNVMTTEMMYAAVNMFSRLSLISHLIAVSVYLIAMLLISWKVTLFAMFFVGLSMILTGKVTSATRTLSDQTTAANTRLGFFLVEHLNLFRLHKLTVSEYKALQSVHLASQEVQDKGFRLKRMASLVDAVYEPVVMVSALFVFYISIEYFHATIASIGLFLLMLSRILPLCKTLIANRQSIYSTMGSLNAVLKGLDSATANADISTGGKAFGGLTQGIGLEQIVFSYSSHDQPVLRGLNVFFPAGKMTALVGPSGAGKSTLVDLLPRLKRPEQGRLVFDGIPAEQYDIASLRRGIAFLSQDPFIFNDTLRANVTIGRADASDTQIWHALDKVQLTAFVKGLPAGLDTVLGERGLRLSGGQKQRLALARVLVQEAPVIVLDEPTSALDSETERAIQDVLLVLRQVQGITMIIIAHRFSTIRNADKIVVLKDGKVLQEGMHQELMASDSWYSMVNDLQLR